MHKEKLDLRHQETLEGRFRSLGAEISEYSFANLYLFREVHDYHLIEKSSLWISGRTRDGLAYAMPTEDPRDMDRSALKEILESHDAIFPVHENWLPAFDESLYSRVYSDDDSDYLYKAEKLATYAGKKMHKKKNLLNQFLNQYSFEAHPVSGIDRDAMKVILKAWMDESGFSESDSDFHETHEAIELLDSLKLKGCVYHVEGEPAGFILGEGLADSVFALHFAKGLKKFKGIYQFMYNHFAGIMSERYGLFNFEQDLGNPELRHAKSSYRPDRMLHKYRVSLR
jgi:hypothetical protein